MGHGGYSGTFHFLPTWASLGEIRGMESDSPLGVAHLSLSITLVGRLFLIIEMRGIWIEAW